jgi:hypothetical protein
MPGLSSLSRRAHQLAGARENTQAESTTPNKHDRCYPWKANGKPVEPTAIKATHSEPPFICAAEAKLLAVVCGPVSTFNATFASAHVRIQSSLHGRKPVSVSMMACIIQEHENADVPRRHARMF